MYSVKPKFYRCLDGPESVDKQLGKKQNKWKSPALLRAEKRGTAQAPWSGRENVMGRSEESVMLDMKMQAWPKLGSQDDAQLTFYRRMLQGMRYV